MSSSTSGSSSGGASRQPTTIKSSGRTSDKPTVTLSTSQKTSGAVDTSSLAGIMSASATPSRAPSPTLTSSQMSTPVTLADRLGQLSANERIGLQVGGRSEANSLAIGDVMQAQARTEASAMPGVAGAVASSMSRLNLSSQLDALKAGGTPVFDTQTGKTVGVMSKDGRYSGDSRFTQAATKSFSSGTTGAIELFGANVVEQARQESKASTPAPTSSPKPAVEEESLEGTVLSQAESRGRGTRGKRFGAGGTILEGTGALYD